MKIRLELYAVLLIALLGNITSTQAKTITKGLSVEYQNEPLGIDVNAPRFNWQLSSDLPGTSQIAYQLTVALTPDDLKNGRTVFDSGKIKDSNSVGIVYQGPALKPSTRYYWSVKVWDYLGNEIEPANSWFETGLIGNDWSGAQWIGSAKAQLSKYRSIYSIDYDVTLSGKNRIGVFVFGARDDRNYVTATIDEKKNTFSIDYLKEGKTNYGHSFDLKNILNDQSDTHHVTLDVGTQDMQQYMIMVTLDGKPLDSGKFFTMTLFDETELVHQCRLYAIGSNQPKGTHAQYSNIRISEKTWGTTLYTKDESYNAPEGLHTWLPGEGYSAPMLRKTIVLDKPISSARLYATARGIYEFSINGKQVGRDFLNPGWTDYRYRIMYNTYDITALLKEGANGIGATVGTGWWSDHMGFSPAWQDQYGIHQSVMAKILVTFGDGSSKVFVTDKSWKCYDNGPITSNSLLNGVDYDARKEIPQWTLSSYDDSSWQDVTVYPAPPITTEIQAYVGSPIRSEITLTAKSMAEPQKNVYVYDMGQNMVGVSSIRLKGNKGQEITVRYGEMNYPTQIPTDPVAPYTKEMYEARKGQVYTDNYRSALSTDHYILKGDPEGEIFEPHFTSHGFRYIELIGLDSPVALTDVKGLVIESIGQQTSGYETSDERINRLYENIVWGQRGNFLSVPTDCPQRDERMGWTGDAQVFSRTATYNMNVDPFYTRWLYTVRDNQGDDGNYCNYYPNLGIPPYGSFKGEGAAGWREVGIVVPWQVYQQYGDIRILQQHYNSMVSFISFLERNAVNYIQPEGGYGDWLAPDPSNSILTNTAYSAYDAQIMEKVATILGKKEDAARFHTFYENIKRTFNEQFVDEEGYTVASGKKVNTQTSYTLGLQFDLFNETNKPLAVRHLVDNIKEHNYTLTTGFIGTPYLNLVLSENGEDETAYKLFQQTAYPSWLYPVMQGATTIWERWNSYTIVNGFGPVGMNSFNHYSYGAIEEWMMAYSAGIQRDEQHPGYKHFILQPRIGGDFSFIRAHYDCVYGRIESGWTIDKEKVIYKATVPPNTTATLYLPVSKEAELMLKLTNNGVTKVASDKGKVLSLPSGSYEFEFDKSFIEYK